MIRTTFPHTPRMTPLTDRRIPSPLPLCLRSQGPPLPIRVAVSLRAQRIPTPALPFLLPFPATYEPAETG